MHPGLEDELEVHVEVVYVRLVLIILEVSLCKAEFTGVLGFELLCFLFDHVQ